MTRSSGTWTAADVEEERLDAHCPGHSGDLVIGELGVDVQVSQPDGKTLMWLDIHSEAFAVVKPTAVREPDTDKLIVTVNADGKFVAGATVVPNRGGISDIEPSLHPAPLRYRLAGHGEP